MSLTLSSSDRARVASLRQTLLSPLAYAHVDGWRAATGHRMKELVGADTAWFVLPTQEAHPLYSAELSDTARQDYLTHYAERDLCFPRMKERRLYVGNPPTLWGNEADRYFGSELYNDFCAPNGIHECLYLFTDEVLPRALDGSAPGGDGAPEQQAPDMAMVMLARDRFGDERFEDWGVSVLRLLYPAFKAGVQTYLRFAAYRRGLLQMLDLLEEGVVLYGLAGNILYENRAYARLLENEPERDRLKAAAGRLMRTLAPANGTTPHQEPVLVAPVIRHVETARGAYRMQSSHVMLNAAGAERCIMVSVTRRVPEYLPEATLRERFGLTRQEARVALLMAQRQANEEVAGALCISRHTAKRHAENVLFKLDVRTRGTVALKVMAQSLPK